MPSKADTEWYKCTTCKSYVQGRDNAKVNHRAWGHRLKKALPLRLRLAHKADEDIPQFITVNVDDDKWNVLLRLAFFKTDERKKTYHLSNIILNTPIDNIVKQLNSILPNIKLTKVELVKLLKKAIIKGAYSEVSETSIKVLLTLDSWLLLKPRNPHSKLVYTSHAKIAKLIKKVPQTTVYAKPVR